jgi:DNA-binding LacI/PurR family transcriptional regulator
MAIAGLGVAHKRGVRIPEDLSVIGFDGTDLAAYVHPPLTTVTTNPFGWGQAAARTLLSSVDRGDPAATPDVDLEPGRLEVRASTARVTPSTAGTARRRASGTSTSRKPTSRKEKR